MRTPLIYVAVSVFVAWLAVVPSLARAQAPPPPPPPMPASGQGSVKITLDDAIQMALAHNHTLRAERTTIDQSEAQETTANLRPNPVLLGDAQFLPIFNWNEFNATYVDSAAQFDLGISYLFERGKKRQHRFAAAKDQTAVTRSTVADNERTLTFQLAQLFTNLIENALVHTPPGTHVVSGLRATGTDVLAEVRDDGPGIPVSERDKVFRRFYRCDASRNTPGAGLGLSLVAAIAALHEATVSLTDSTPGLRVGITFAGPDLGEAEEALRRAVPNTSRSNSWKGRM